MEEIIEIFAKHFHLDSQNETSAEGSEVKIKERIKAFDKMIEVRPSFSRAVELFKKSLTKEQLNLIEITLVKEDLIDFEEYDDEPIYREIKIKLI